MGDVVFFCIRQSELVWSLRLSRAAAAAAQSSMTLAKTTLSSALAVAAVCAASEAQSPPLAWAYLSSAVWTIWLVSKGWNAMHFWDRVHLIWGAGSVAALCKFAQLTALAGEPFEVSMCPQCPTLSCSLQLCALCVQSMLHKAVSKHMSLLTGLG